MLSIEKAAELLGWSAPLTYALAVYAAFYWLDSKASDEAKQAVSN